MWSRHDVDLAAASTGHFVLNNATGDLVAGVSIDGHMEGLQTHTHTHTTTIVRAGNNDRSSSTFCYIK